MLYNKDGGIQKNPFPIIGQVSQIMLQVWKINTDYVAKGGKIVSKLFDNVLVTSRTWPYAKFFIKTIRKIVNRGKTNVIGNFGYG